ncbi:MAG TPA: hypothetical protein VK327_12240, partial [Candidatus Paceibacterota bacterium]|nr:hypothetical protein [Candidatus Paceibacterota bacterium]
MLYFLSQKLVEWAEGTAWAEHISALRLFRYITVRSAGAAITALLLSLWLGPKVIRWLQRLKFGQEYKDIAEQHGAFDSRIISKKGTPTMGGILIVAVLSSTTLLWTAWNPLVELTLLSLLVLAGLGFYDDYAKITQQSGHGTKPQVKLWVQVGLALFVAVYLWQLPAQSWLKIPEEPDIIHSNLITIMMVPFYKYPIAVGAIVGIILTMLTIVGSSNAV